MRGQPFYLRISIASLTCLIGCLIDTSLRSTILAQQEVVFSFPEGHARLNPVTTWRFGNEEDAMLWMVQDKHVQEELEIVETQSIELRQAVLEDAERLRRHLLFSAGEPAKSTSLRDGQDIREPLRKVIRDMLLPHQEEKLESFYCWSVSRYQGSLALALHVADQTDVSLTSDEEQKIGEAAKRLEKALVDFAMSEYRSLLERTGERFPYCGDHLLEFANSTTPVSLDVLFADYQAIDELSMDDFAESLTEMIRAQRRGSFLPFSNLRVEQFPDGDSAWAEAVRLLGIPDADSGGLLSAEQRIAIDLLANSASEEFRRIAIEYHKQMEVSPRDARAAMLDAKNRLDQKSMKYLESEILLPHQVKWLVDALRQRRIHSYGLLGVLLITAGPDGKQNSAPDRDEIRKFLEKEIAVLRDKVTKEFHKNVWQQVDEMPESIRTEVRQRLGEPPEYLLPVFSNLAQRVCGD